MNNQKNNTNKETVPYGKSKKRIAALLTILLMTISVLPLAGCGGGDADKAEVPPLETAAGAEKTAAETIVMPGDDVVAIVLDVTGSTKNTFEEGVRDALVSRVANYFPPKPADTRDGVEAVPGLRLTIYLVVSANANAYNDDVNHNNLVCVIPGTPGLPGFSEPEPEITADGATEEYMESYHEWKTKAREWKDAEQAWSEAYDESLARARAAAEEIANMNLIFDTSGNVSGIYNTICASLSAISAGRVSVGIFSDLLENGTDLGAPPAGKSGPVVICVPAPDGDVRAANERAEALSLTMAAWGFDKAQIYGPALLDGAVTRVFEG